MADIVITIPKSIKWADYKKELDKVKDGKEVMNFKVPNFPLLTGVGDKCYVVYDGFIVGWMVIVAFSDLSFTCTTTGRNMNGKFIQRSGIFNKLETPIPKKGFQGYRYMDSEL
jgi:hypothetical protein